MVYGSFSSGFGRLFSPLLLFLFIQIRASYDSCCAMATYEASICRRQVCLASSLLFYLMLRWPCHELMLVVHIHEPDFVVSNSKKISYWQPRQQAREQARMSQWAWKNKQPAEILDRFPLLVLLTNRKFATFPAIRIRSTIERERLHQSMKRTWTCLGYLILFDFRPLKLLSTCHSTVPCRRPKSVN